MSTNNNAFLTIAMCALYSILAVQASAQDVLRSEKRVFLPPEASGIPKVFSPEGLVYKGFEYYPSINMRSVYSDNVYAASQSEQDDLFVRVEPSLRILKDYKNLKLSGKLNASFERYNELVDENKNDFEIGLNGAYTVNSRWSIPFSAERVVLSRDRGEPLQQTSTTEPLRVIQNRFSAGVSKRFNRLTLSLIGQYEQSEFSDGISRVDGSPIIY